MNFSNDLVLLKHNLSSLVTNSGNTVLHKRGGLGNSTLLSFFVVKLLAMGFIAILLTLIVLIFPKSTKASEGTIEIFSTTNYSYRCFAASIQMMDLNYKILITCRDLLYPAGEDIFTYMAWATPVSGDKAFKLGALGLGRAEFVTKTPFSTIFVTTEQNSKTKDPTGPVVMKGNIEKVTFLELPTTPTPGEEIEQAEGITTPSPALSARQRLIKGFRRAGVVTLLALVSVFGLVFVLTRPK